jgi:transposase
MRNRGSPAELEHCHLLAVQRVREGYSTEEVADFLGVNPRSVRRWIAAYRQGGGQGLRSRPASGRPPKLTTTQETIVRQWVADNPREHGFETELWTAPRLAQLIREEFGIPLHPKYLKAWLRDRGFTPQKPQRVPRERDPAALAAWLATDWPLGVDRFMSEARAITNLIDNGVATMVIAKGGGALDMQRARSVLMAHTEAVAEEPGPTLRPCLSSGCRSPQIRNSRDRRSAGSSGHVAGGESAAESGRRMHVFPMGPRR